jgi:formyltetrahydrofolate synthetase
LNEQPKGLDLHFRGDFNASGLANNRLAAMIDRHIHCGCELHTHQAQSLDVTDTWAAQRASCIGD